MKRKLMAIMLCLALAFTMMPTLGGFSYAAEIIGVSSVSEDGIVTWEMEEGSTRARVGLYSYTTELGQAYVGTENSFDIFQWLTENKVESGRYQARIEYYDASNKYKVIISDYFDYVSPLEKLATPTNLRFDGKISRWDSVEGATGYSVILISTEGYQDKSRTTTNNYYDWSKEPMPEGIREYYFTVKATGDASKLDSDLAESEVGTIDNSLPSLQNVTISEEGIMSWDPLEGATKYFINIGGSVSTITDTSVDLLDYCSKNNVAVGNPLIHIRAQNRSGLDASKAYETREWEYKGKLAAPAGFTYKAVSKAVAWSAVPNAEKYRVKVYRQSTDQPPVKEEVLTTTQVGLADVLQYGSNSLWVEVTAVAKGYACSDPVMQGPYRENKLCEGEHTYGEWYEAAEADCTSGVLEQRNCTICGHADAREVGEPLGHLFENYVFNNDETCTQDGTETAVCEREGCGEEDTRTKEGTKIGHIFQNFIVKLDDFYHGKSCRLCGIESEKAPHSMGSPTVVTNPTCTEEGLQRSRCIGCEYTVESPIDPLDHSFTNYVYNGDATCTQDGTETAVCDREGCNAEDTRTKVGSKLPHRGANFTYDETTHTQVCMDCEATLVFGNHEYGPYKVLQPATCIEEGWRVKICTLCNKVVEEEIPLADHTFTTYNYNNDATCTADGTETATCDVVGCDATDTRDKEGTKLNHQCEDNYITADDYIHHYYWCELCNSEYGREEHQYGEFIVDKNSTCETQGNKYRQCAVCSLKQNVPIDPLGHQFGDYTYDNNATCYADGTETAHCQREGCGKTDTRTKAGTKLEHAFTTYVADGNATCISRGTETAHCDNEGCSVTDTRNVTTGAFGEHQSGDAFAYNETSHWHTCALCGERLSSTVTAHNYGEEIIDTAAGCETPGAKHRICQDCGYREDSVINPLGHETEKHNAVESTCTVAGNEEYYSCTRCDKYFANAAATTEIEEDSWILELEPHDYELHGAVEVPCDKDRDGREEHLCCSVCHQTAVYDEHGHIVETDKFHNDFLIPGGHDIIEKQRVEPTCTTDGNEHHFYCTRCHKAFMDEGLIMEYDEGLTIIPKLGHRFEHYVEDNNATCYNDGTETAHCENPGCSEVDTRIIEDTALGHDFSLTQKKTDATCECNEIWERECSRCHKKQEFEEPNTKLGHNCQLVEWVSSTCSTQGNSAYYDCTRCDKYFKDAACTIEIEEGSWVLPLADHDNVHYDGKAATCTEAGYKAYDVCSTCGNTTYEAIDALGHDKVHHEAKAPTCLEAGWDAYDTCSRCDYSTKVEKPALGHQIAHHDAKVATCTRVRRLFVTRLLSHMHTLSF